MNCHICDMPLQEGAAFCANCGAPVAPLAPVPAAAPPNPVPPAAPPAPLAAPAPEGFTEDPQSKLYYRYTVGTNPQSGVQEQWITWFNPATGNYKQECLTPRAPAAAQQKGEPQAPANKKTANGKKILIPIISVLVLCAAGTAVWLTGLYRYIPFLNFPAQTQPPALSQPSTVSLPRSAVESDVSLPKNINHSAHISTEFTVYTDGAGNPLPPNGILILFDGSQPEIEKDDITGAVMTQNGQPVPVDYEVIWSVHGDGKEAPVQTSYEIFFSQPLSVGAEGKGTYAFSCNIQGAAYSTGDFYFAPPPAPSGANWAAAYSGFLKTQFLTTKEFLHYSDLGVFPVHILEGREAAVMQADFYNIPGFDYPVMALVEFLPQEGNPAALDTYAIETVYLVKDGAVTYDMTDEETAAVYSVSEESGMNFVNGELIDSFGLVSWEGDAPAEEYLQRLFGWLDEFAAMEAANAGVAAEGGGTNLLELIYSYTMQDLIDDGSIAGGVPDIVEGERMYYLSSAFTNVFVGFQFQDPPRPEQLRVEALKMSVRDLFGKDEVGIHEVEELLGTKMNVVTQVAENGDTVFVASTVIDGLLFRLTGNGKWYYDVYIEQA